MRRQHGVLTRSDLLELGFGPRSIEHRIGSGRLHPVYRGVYAVGRRRLDREGRWMAAVLACGRDAALSHRSAAALWEFAPEQPDRIDVSVVRTLLDIATELPANRLERAINEADKRDAIDPDRLRRALDDHRGEPGIRLLRKVLDKHTFRLSDDELELLFRPIAVAAGLPTPLTKQKVDRFEVDFFWPDLGLVVETDGWRYHRTPAAQTRDALRFQAHTAAGLTPLRFSHHQVKYDPRHVRNVLEKTAENLRGRPAPSPGK